MRWSMLLVSGLVACGGNVQKQVWEHQVRHGQTAIQLFYIYEYAPEWVTTGSVAARTVDGEVIREEECERTGSVKLLEGGDMCFDECVVGKGQRLHGSMRFEENASGRDDLFIDLELGTDDPPETIEGSYTWDGDVLTQQLDIAGFDDSGNLGRYTETVRNEFTVTTEGDTLRLSGTMTITTDAEFDPDAPSTTECTFEDVVIEDWIDVALKGSTEIDLNRLCPQAWEDEVKQVIFLRHLNDDDPDPVHFVLPGQEFQHSPRVRQHRKKRQAYKLERGTHHTVQIGRQGTVFGSAQCPPATDLEALTAVYDEGLAGTEFTFLCFFDDEVDFDQ